MTDQPTLICSYYATTIFNDTQAAAYFTIVDATGGSLTPGTTDGAMGVAIADVVTQINATTGKFALAGMSYGAWVVSNVLKEIQSGSLTGRAGDFLGGVVMGNPAREAAHTLPGITGAIDPGGHGICDADKRLTDSPSNWFEFAAPGDIIAVNGDDTAGELASAVFDFIYYNTVGAQQDLTTAVDEFATASTSQQLVELYNSITEGATWQVPSESYTTYTPITGDTRNCVEVAADQLVAMSSGAGYAPDPASDQPSTYVASPFPPGPNAATCYTFAATSAATFIPISGDYGQFDMQVGEGLDPQKWNVQAIDYPGAHMAWDGEGTDAFIPGYSFLSGAQVGVDAAVKAIGNTPGPFAFAAYSLGSLVAKLVYDELAPGGRLESRAADFVGAVTFGSSVRQAGHTIPGGTDPGGHGVFGPAYRMTDAPASWWDFADSDPLDPFTTVGDDTAGLDASAVADVILTNGTNGTDLTVLWDTLTSMTSEQAAAIWTDIAEMIFPFASPEDNTSGHGNYNKTYYGLADNTLSAVALAINYLNSAVSEVEKPSPLNALGQRIALCKQNRAQRRAVKGGTPSIRAYMNDTVDTITPGITYYGRIDVKDTNDYEFPQRNNFSTTGQIRLRANHYVAQWVITNPNTPAALQNIIFIVDMYGGNWRWSGLVHHYELETVDGCDYVTIFINDDMQFLQFLLAPPNPSLPLYVFQFPRVWFIFGPSIWCISVTILLNLIRTEGHEWTLPDDPYNLDSWIAAPDFATWQIQVKSVDFFTDSSLWTLLASRMNTIDSMIADALDDGQLTVVYRRILVDEGESVTGLLDNNVGNGCLVYEIIDRSGFTLPGGTFFNGTAAAGLVRSTLTWTDGFVQDTLNEAVDSETLYPDEYWQTSWLGTLASAPGIAIRDTHWNDLQSKVSHSVSTAPTVIIGGDNPMADAIVQLIIESVGNILGFALLGGFDSLGDIASDVIMPFLVGTIVAWDEWENTGRAQELGWVHLIEVYQSGAENNSWSLAALEVLRGGFAGTRSQTSHTMVINWTTWVVPGLDFQIGDRIASTSGAIQRAGLDIMFVNQVEEMTLSGKGDGSFQFFCKVGQNKASMTPGEREARLFKKFLNTLNNVGVHLIS
jgi:hypothetical protein